MPIINSPRISLVSTRRLNSAIRYLDLEHAVRFRNVTISDSARTAAKKKINTRIQEKQAEFQRRRSVKTRQRLRKRPVLFKQAQKTVSTLIAEQAPIDAQKILHPWATRSKNTSRLRLIEGQIPGMRNRKRNLNSWPTRFIVETTQEQSLKAVSQSVQEAFGIDRRARLSTYKISVRPLFKKFQTRRFFVVTLACPRRTTKTAAQEIAGALKKAANLRSVRSENVDLRLQRLNLRVDGAKIVPPDTEWHLRKMNVFEAWSESGNQQGEGIVIGHPDSGWRPHPQYDEINPHQGKVMITKAHNVLTGNTGPDEALHDTAPRTVDQAILNNLTHGTATGSMMVSERAQTGTTSIQNIPDPGKGAPVGVQITGVAPKARVLPVKCVTSVVLIGDTNVAHAIEYLIEQKVDVISISLGGTPHHCLEAIISEAVRQHNIIVVCAAGQVNGVPDNETHFYHDTVIEPGAYADTIAVAASTVNDKPWADTFRGRNVDFSAPGHLVWFADFDEDGSRRIKYGSGTSFAAAVTASVAALWLGAHGKQNLLNRYHGSSVTLSDVFRHLVRETARKPRIIDRTPPGTALDVDEPWDEKHFGAGVIDAQALLSAPLPPAEAVPLPPAQESNFISWIQDMIGIGEQVVSDLTDLGQDTLDYLAEASRRSAEFAENFLTVMTRAAQKEAEDAARDTAEFLKTQWGYLEAVAESASGTVKQEAEKAARDVADAWEDAQQAVEDVADEVADTAEDVVEAATEVAEDVAEGMSEGTKDVLNFIGGLF